MMVDEKDGTPTAGLAALVGVPLCTNEKEQSNEKYSLDSSETQPRLTRDQARRIGTIPLMRVLAREKLPCTAIVMLAEIISTYSHRGEYFQSVQSLTDKVGRCKRTVQRWFRKLEQLGFIEVIYRDGTTNQVFPRLFDNLATLLNNWVLQAKRPGGVSNTIKEYFLNGKKYTVDQVREYINNKTARFARSKTYEETLWKHAEKGTLSTKDFQQYLTNNDKDELVLMQQNKEEQEKKRKKTLHDLEKQIRKVIADGRPLSQLEEMAQEAAKHRSFGPLGGIATVELVAIRHVQQGGEV